MSNTPPSASSPPSYILKMFIMNKSCCMKNPNPKYEEIVKMYEEKVEAHNKKVFDSEYPDSGFDLFIPYDYSEHENGYTDNRLSQVTFRAPLGVKCSMSRFIPKYKNQSLSLTSPSIIFKLRTVSLLSLSLRILRINLFGSLPFILLINLRSNS